MQTDLLKLRESQGISYFLSLLRGAGIANPEAIAIAAREFSKEDPLNQIRAMCREWYYELRVKGAPKYEIYGYDMYLAEVWVCWSAYSRKYLSEAKKIRDRFGGVAKIVDLGNGLGLTTAALKQIFPGAKVIGTNIEQSSQWKIAERLSSEYGFEMKSNLTSVGGGADLLLASEYFEHFDRPIEHLREVIRQLHPRQLLIANAFNVDSIGHFDFYRVDGKQLDGRSTSKVFNDTMRKLGYGKQDLGFWNNRPTYWVRED